MSTLFKPELARIVERFESKGDCLNYMTELLSESGCLSFPDRYLAAVKGREEIMSTGIGRGIAIPHARDLTVNCLKIAVCKLDNPLDFNSVDNQPVNLVFMIAVPQSSNHQYMQILRSLSEHLRQDQNRAVLLRATTDRELYNYVHEIENIIGKSLAD
ncbi:MAG: PTS sugar transporter subunit IIA [Candidatus Cloacimonetes bacterium]|jgi:mannitol/fructose-specific phosphotransferase system IIA component (Ntr-type)|nr:PTS sugar transporter subunit IIA [Candidatus Cloacimonadota bacterium]MDY0337184.1 PTS sugar transporter subunit IIA [Candidatus Cloacimonadaceae bacterium]MCK9333704.1 PTS sugar transporter subunit IIA [Candidatus Cloacimonadota bacterium]MDD2543572.1 PTS sugar transporter subunit IIA [Candidatus Cloacimonadota bacterium]MDD2682505.1 PTS sugar transporter subunit IIA [Candidatus Cloacimonadota bacterium]